MVYSSSLPARVENDAANQTAAREGQVDILHRKKSKNCPFSAATENSSFSLLHTAATENSSFFLLHTDTRHRPSPRDRRKQRRVSSRSRDAEEEEERLNTTFLRASFNRSSFLSGVFLLSCRSRSSGRSTKRMPIYVENHIYRGTCED